MTEQLQMIWPETELAEGLGGRIPLEYRLRGFRAGDEESYIALMHRAGFDSWNRDNLEAVLKNAVPDGIVFAEHEASAQIVATAMGWYRPSAIFPDAHELGWVAGDPSHRGKRLGQAVTVAATRVLLEHGARRIYLLTDDWRLPAIKVYLKVGYAPFCWNSDMRSRWRDVFIKSGLDMAGYPELLSPA
jgi:mycothiol synthase